MCTDTIITIHHRKHTHTHTGSWSLSASLALVLSVRVEQLGRGETSKEDVPIVGTARSEHIVRAVEEVQDPYHTKTLVEPAATD